MTHARNGQMIHLAQKRPLGLPPVEPDFVQPLKPIFSERVRVEEFSLAFEFK